MSRLNLVTGANGHLGNNIVRYLLAKGEKVRAGVRQLNDRTPFEGLNCEIVACDLSNLSHLERALNGVEILYQVAAVYKRWAKDPQNEIYEANMIGTRNIIQAAAKAGVKKIIYISSAAALDHSKQPLTEETWNSAKLNIYEQSKTDSEKLALQLAKELKIELVSILPNAMIGGLFFSLTPTLAPFKAILKKEMPFDPNIALLYVDVNDVAKACYAAVERGKPGERYLISSEQATSSKELMELSSRWYPKMNLKVPQIAPRWLLLIFATLSEMVSKFTNSAPVITRSDVKIFYGLMETANVSKARRDLSLELTPIEVSLKNTFDYVNEKFVLKS